MASKAITEDSQRHIHCPHLADDGIAKIPISKTVLGQATIRRDIKSGKVSSKKGEKGHRRIDIAESQRVSHLTLPPDRQTTAHDSQIN